MSIDDQQDLRDKLGAALDGFALGPLPLNAVVRQGRMVLIRKRVTAVAVGLAILIAAALAPALLHSLSRPAPVARHYHVTVFPPDPGAPPGLIASGLVDHAHWQLTVRYHAHPPQICYASIPGFSSCGGGFRPSGRIAAPAAIFGDPDQVARAPGGRGVKVQMLYGIVRHDVDHLLVRLGNGQVLVLHPVPVLGSRYASYVALAVPFAAAVREVIVYSASGEVAHAVPFTSGGSIEIVRWLPADQPALPKPVTARLGTGTIGGVAWSARAYLGPWGACFTSAAVQMDLCRSRTSLLRPGGLVAAMALAHSGHVSLTALQVAPAVSRLTVITRGGRIFRLRAVQVGDRRYCVVPAEDHDPPVSWAAYDAAGRRLGAGRAAGW